MTGYEVSAWVLVGMVAMVYLLPTLIAFGRGSPRAVFVLVVNVCTGWTLAGWLWSFVMACW